MENIIIVDSNNHIWAAVIDDKKVRYFTNVPAYYAVLPKTIDNWRGLFKNYPVFYMSKK